MKIKRVKAEGEFQSIKLELVIESKEELHDLWHRLNLSNNEVRENLDDNDYPFHGTIPQSFWKLIDSILEKLK